jgi:hypothetical protein
MRRIGVVVRVNGATMRELSAFSYSEFPSARGCGAFVVGEGMPGILPKIQSIYLGNA